MMVDRCICYDITFAKLKARDAAVAATGSVAGRDVAGTIAVDATKSPGAESQGLTLHARLEALCTYTGCSTNCGMCKPYIIEMLKTGRIGFPLFSEAAAARILAEFAGSGPTTRQ
jgi:hypothetical protein